MSRICEEFPGTLPTRALWELEHDPDQLVLTIMQLRAYARTKAAMDRAKTAEEAPTGALADLVMDITTDLVREAIAARRAARGVTGQDDGRSPE